MILGREWERWECVGYNDWAECCLEGVCDRLMEESMDGRGRGEGSRYNIPGRTLNKKKKDDGM